MDLDTEFTDSCSTEFLADLKTNYPFDYEAALLHFCLREMLVSQISQSFIDFH